MLATDIPTTSFNPKVRWWTDSEWLGTYDRFLTPDKRPTGGIAIAFWIVDSHCKLSRTRFDICAARRLNAASIAAQDQLLSVPHCREHTKVKSTSGLIPLKDCLKFGPNDADWKKGQLASAYEVAANHLAEFSDFCELKKGMDSGSLPKRIRQTISFGSHRCRS